MIKIIKETIVDLELSSVCNLSCIYCPRDKIKRKRRFIDLSSINQLADHLDPGKIVWFSGMGEPFLHPDLTAIITILRTSGALIYTNTNATAPHFQKTLTAAQQAGLNFVNVSVYGFDTESFQFTSQRDLFLILKENIEFLKASGLPYRLSYVQTEESPPNIKDRLETTFETKHIRLLKQHHRSFAPRPSPKIQCGLAQNYLFISSDGDIFPVLTTSAALVTSAKIF